VPDLDVRGRVVRLGASIDTILDRHGYPEPVSRVLGEAAALTVLLGTALKFEGRFQLQTKSDGAIPMMVVDFNAPDNFAPSPISTRPSSSRRSRSTRSRPANCSARAISP
jgi:molecular chaperone Hsp33